MACRSTQNDYVESQDDCSIQLRMGYVESQISYSIHPDRLLGAQDGLELAARMACRSNQDKHVKSQDDCSVQLRISISRARMVSRCSERAGIMVCRRLRMSILRARIATRSA